MPPNALATGQFNDSFPPIIDGVAILTLNYARWLNRKYGRGHVVTVAAPGFADGSDGDDPPVLRYRSIPLPLKKPYRYGLPSLDRAFQERLAGIPFDIVHAHNPFVAGRLALRTARSLGIPIVATFHSKYREDFRRVVHSDRAALALARQFTRFYGEVDAVWTVSESTVDVLREYGYRGQVEVMPNGSDLEPPADRGPLRRRAEAAWGLGTDDFVLLHVGRLVWEKNLRLLFDALREVARRPRRFRMLFVGDGPAAGPMKAFVKREGLAEMVRFTGGVQDRQCLQELYARADLLLLPSLYDMSSLVQKEAAAFGLPGVFVRGATTASQVRDGENGFLAANDAGAFAARIAALMDAPGTIRTAGEGAFRTLHLSWEQVVDEVVLRYRSIIERHARASNAA
ncbi:MAG: glycosyltransferase [Spirochaetia bacterium]|jgi:glycosyltransferase involved in cell wall biosynthesis